MTTKTEGEQVATSVKLKPLGGVASQTRVSHPVGTTISVDNFLSKLPVRHQNALKEALKTIGRIKELLQSYSLARPHIRFNLKVTKGAKGSWSFAPRPSDGIKEAVSQVIGRDAASQCIERFASFPENGRLTSPTIGTESGADAGEDEFRDKLFVVDMFLPRPDADFSKVSCGQYISVDGRPVSSERGTMKRIITIFKSYVRCSISDTEQKINNPILRLSIKCPMGSYDPNVEPAKDDVLFCNEYVVLEAVENVFKDLYGELKEHKRPQPDRRTPAQSMSSKLDDFELLMSRTRPPPSSEPAEGIPASGETRGHSNGEKFGILVGDTAILDSEEECEPSPGRPKRSWHVDMSREFNEEVETPRQAARGFAQRESPYTAYSPPSSNPLNPWLIAKMTAPVREMVEPAFPSPAKSNGRPGGSLPTRQQSSDPANSKFDLLDPDSPQIRSRQAVHNSDLESIQQSVEAPRRQSFSGFPGLATPSIQRPMTASTDEDLLASEVNTMTMHRRSDFTTARNVINSQISTPTFQPHGPKRQRTINKPFVSPLLPVDRPNPPDGLRQTTLTVGPRPARINYPENIGEEDSSSELAWAMDFENRKEEATRRRREQIRAALLEAEVSTYPEELLGASSPPRQPGRSSPHKKRCNTTLASLSTPHASSEAPAPVERFKTNLPDGDPRGYFMRRQKSLLKPGAPKISRAKSMRLPLERIPDGEQLNKLVLPLSSNMESINRMYNGVGTNDVYISRGSLSDGLKMNNVSKGVLVKRLRRIVEEWKGNFGEEGAEVEYFLENLKCSG